MHGRLPVCAAHAAQAVAVGCSGRWLRMEEKQTGLVSGRRGRAQCTTICGVGERVIVGLH